MNNFSKYAGTFLLIFSLIFGACRTEPIEQNSDTTISAFNNDAESYFIDSVTGTSMMKIHTNKGYMIVDSGMGNCIFKNNQFELKLPSSVNLQRLQNPDLTHCPNLYVSDTLFRTTSRINICAFSKGKNCGRFVLTNLTKELYCDEKTLDYTEVFYLYVDRPVEIRGNYCQQKNNAEYLYNYNLIFRKGWNTLCCSAKSISPNSVEINYNSNEIPVDVNWIYIDNSILKPTNIFSNKSFEINI